MHAFVPYQIEGTLVALRSAEEILASTLPRVIQPCSLRRRISDRRTNSRSPFRAAVYLLANLISRREIYRKQRRKLGQAHPLAVK